MSTRKMIITQKYLEFQSNVKEIIDIDIFPSLEDIDLVDLLIYFNLYFEHNINYYDTIKDLLFLKNIKLTDAQLNEILPLITKCINEFKLIQKLI